MAKSKSTTSRKGYTDLYLLPLPKKNLAKYRSLATRFGRIIREYGALTYRELIGEDLFPKGVVSFTTTLDPGRNGLLIAAVVDFQSRAHRDLVLKEMFDDPRMQKMMKETPLMDMRKMIYGGFEAFVTV